MKRLLLLLSLGIMSQTVYGAACGIGARFIEKNPRNLHKRMERRIVRCIKNHYIRDWEEMYDIRTLDDTDGFFTYYSENGRERFSTRDFTDDGERYFYFRDSNRNDFRSLRFFSDTDGEFTYFRDKNRNDFFSLRRFADGEDEFFLYIRDKDRDDVYSVKVLADSNGDYYVYFRDTNRNDIISLRVELRFFMSHNLDIRMSSCEVA